MLVNAFFYLTFIYNLGFNFLYVESFYLKSIGFFLTFVAYALPIAYKKQGVKELFVVNFLYIILFSLLNFKGYFEEIDYTWCGFIILLAVLVILWFTNTTYYKGIYQLTYISPKPAKILKLFILQFFISGLFFTTLFFLSWGFYYTYLTNVIFFFHWFTGIL